MGLDMYLKASRYVGGWDHSDETDKKNFAALLEKINLNLDDVDDGSPSITVNVTVGYWRKANAIHAWFVKNVQGGEDKCQKAYVTREHLIQLKYVCKEVLADISKASVLLPPQSGFFFGSTAVDEWYIDDLKHTVKIIDKCLSERFTKFSFEYQSSW